MDKPRDIKKLGQGFVDLKKLNEAELRELLERQAKLLHNKAFIRTLPDKGVKIDSFHKQIADEISRRSTMDSIANALSRVNLAQEVEWNGQASKETVPLDSDDDSDQDIDPLKLIANHSGTQTSRIKKEETPTQSLVTANDITEINHSYSNQFCEKYDKMQVTADRFKPSEPKKKDEVKSGFKRSSEKVKEKLGSHWEVTAATPPVPVHGDTKIITLAESLQLQKEQVQRLKEIQIKEANIRLGIIASSSKSEGSSSSATISNHMQYRKPPDPCNLFEGTPVREQPDDDFDGDEAEKGGAVFYNIVDDVQSSS